MKVRLLGGGSGDGGSPRLWITERGTFAAQGWKTEVRNRIEIPHRLLAYAEPGTCLSGLVDTGHGTFLVTGDPLTDPEALELMNMPTHEAAVEIPIELEVTPDAPIRT